MGKVIVNYPPGMNDFDLSLHLKAREIACPCCKKVLVLPRLLLAFENTRERLGLKSFIVTSGVRCVEYQVEIYRKINERRVQLHLPLVRAPLVGYHVTGEAIDSISVEVPGPRGSMEEREFIEELQLDGWVGVGVQHRVFNRDGVCVQDPWVHLDVRLGAPALWYYDGGR